MSARGKRALLLGADSGTVAEALAPLQLSLTTIGSLLEAGVALGANELIIALHPAPLERLRETMPQVPVLLVNVPADEVLRLLESGAADALPLPLDPPLLRAKAAALLTLRRSEQAVTRAEAAQQLAEAAQKLAEAAQLRAEAGQRAAEEAGRLKDQFLATLSHEMRTPLTSILGWVRLLRMGKASADPQGRPLEAIERNARLQAQLVADLLDAQRISAGKMSLTFRDVELGGLVEAAVHSLRGAAEDAGLLLRVTRPLDEDLRVFGDADRLHQIVTSLVGNAIKFSTRGGSVQVQLLPSDTELVLIVRDSGRGIDPSFLPHAFEAFRQEDAQLSRDKGGLGLGLSLVRNMVELHGGSVSADSEGEGTGARFTVSLPLRSRASRASVPAPAPERTPHRDLQGVRVLLVEDDADAQYLLTLMLEQFGARVTPSGSAAEAITALATGTFDLMLSDVSMPGEDGYSLIRRVRNGTVHPSIPAAALTANARAEDRAQALAAGFQQHIAKPVEPTALVEVLAQLLGRD
jgi:signal transduction histidine kinase